LAESSLLPPNATAAERALETLTRRLEALPHPIQTIWNPATCPVHLLPLLAWGVSIDHWNPDWPETVKRARIAAAIPIQRRKGTARAVRDVVTALGGGVAVREWHELDPPGPPHTFELVLIVNNGSGSTADLVEDCIAEVNRTKPARAHFTFTLGVGAVGGLGLLGRARPAVYRRLEMEAA